MTFHPATSPGMAKPASHKARGAADGTAATGTAHIWGKGVSPSIPQAGRAKHRRLNSARKSECLTLAQAENLIAAAGFAAAIGTPLNRFTTIHWERAGLRAGYQGATLRFLKLAADWLRLRRATFAYTWVREAGSAVGEHVHILLHVPAYLGRAFAARQRGWLRACGATFRKGVIKSRPVGRSLAHAVVGIRYGERYEDHLNRILAYMLKGVNEQARARLGLPQSGLGGSLCGKRCSTSQNLGRAARSVIDHDRRKTDRERPIWPNKADFTARQHDQP